jgi:exopolysaccharide biosynthesis polyprenyl glycosylphosphotransferase
MTTLEEGVQAVALPDEASITLRGRLSVAGEPWVPLFARAVAPGFPVATMVVLSSARPGAVEIALLWAVWFLAIGHTGRAVWLRPLAPRLPLAAAGSAAVGFVGASLVSLWSSDISLTPGGQFVVAGATCVTAAGVELAFARRLARRTRILIVGASEAGSSLLDELRRHPMLHPSNLRMVDDDSREGFEDAIRTEQPDVVVTARDATEVVRSILDAGLVHVRVIGLHGFYEHVVGRVPLAELPPNWFMSVVHLYQRPYSRFNKGWFDLTLAVLGLVILAPLFGLAALLIRLSSKGPILYRQIRLGESGKAFEILKFRTMVEGAELPGAARWAGENDPRITWAGRLLRRSHIDELPQLWNVLRGEMSIVGPRPERPEFLRLLEGEVPFWTRRHLVKPGITGWAQVQAGYASDVASAKEKLSYDLYYLKHRSLALDVAIAVKTVAIALRDPWSRPTRREDSSTNALPASALPHDLLPVIGNGRYDGTSSDGTSGLPDGAGL